MNKKDDDFNEQEMAKSFRADWDRQEASLTRGQVKELEEMLEERRMRKRAVTMASTFAKWIVAVGAGVTILQTGWTSLVKWWVAR